MENTEINKNIDVIDGREAAEIVGTSYWNLLRKVKQSLIPHFRLGRRILFRRSVLNDWMTRQELQSISSVSAEVMQNQGAVRL